MKKENHPLSLAFEELNKKGYFCRRALACCRSCAMHEIPDEFDSSYVFTADYDEEDLKKNSSCYLSWSSPNDNAMPIVRVLRKAGLQVSNFSNPSKRIFIKLN